MKIFNLNQTIPFNFLTFSTTNKTVQYNNIKKVSEFLLLLEDSHIVCTSKLINQLLYLNENELLYIYNILIDSKYYILKFHDKFSTKKNIKSEKYNIEDYIKQILHYYLRYDLKIKDCLFFDKKIKLEKIKSKTPLKIIDFKSFDELKQFIISKLQSKLLFTSNDKILINFYLNKYEIDENIFKIIPIKENFFLIINNISKNIIKEYLKTTNDVLRYICYINKIDYNNIPKHRIKIFKESEVEKNYVKEVKILPNKYVNLQESEKITIIKENKKVYKYNKIKLKTSQKNIIMFILNNIYEDDVLNNFKAKKQIWKAISKSLYPFQKKFNKYPNSQKYFNILNNNIQEIETFNTKMTKYMIDKNIVSLLLLLKDKQGLLLRHLDFIIRNIDDKDLYLLINILIHKNLNNKLLLETITYLKYRIKNSIENRIINIKGKIYPLPKEKNLEKLPYENSSKIIKKLENIFLTNLKDDKEFLTNLGFEKNEKIYLDEKMKSIVLPSTMRNQSKTEIGGVIPTGSRIKLKNTKFLRLFTTWGSLSDNTNIDIDLSATFLTKTGKIKDIAYYNQNEKFANHSGDFTSCFKYEKNKPMIGEFIDIDIKAAKEKYQYIYISNIIYSSYLNDSNYDNMKVFSGVLEINKRNNKTENNGFIIDNALFKMKLCGKYQSHLGFIVDLINNEIIMIDQYFESNNHSNAKSLFTNFNLIKQKFINALDYKENIYSFLKKYCQTNYIEIVDNKNDSDLILTFNQEKIENKKTIDFSTNLSSIFNLI